MAEYADVARTEGRGVMCSPEQLRLHPALDEVRWTGARDEFKDLARLRNQCPPEPILVTTTRIILAGIGRWQRALLDREHQLNCIEYPLKEDEALQFILDYHQPRHGWNDFVRICLALTRKLALQRKAVENMRAGGRYKGSSNLTKADYVNVQEEIAKMAGVCRVNVDKVEMILRNAIPSIISALQSGALKISRARLWCELPKTQQEEEFARFEEERTRRKICREFAVKGAQGLFDVARTIEALQCHESRRPGSIVIRTSHRRRTEIVLGRDLLAALDGEKEASPLA
jgi:hypothetical protein